MDEVQQTKKAKTKRRILILIALLFVLTGIPAGIYIYFASTLPSLNTLHEYNPNIVTKVYSADGQIIGEFFIERRIVVPFSRMPSHLVKAFLAAEDSMFYKHKGIDYWGVLRAFIKNLTAGRIVQGGSTITQQVAKSFFLSPERSFTRKIKEALLAHRIEKSLTKDDILYLYLNQIYLGDGAYGVQAAAETYFGKDVQNLNLAEASLLAGLPKAPTKYSPYSAPAVARQRQEYVLRRMLEEQMITQDDADKALKYKLKLKPKEIRSLWVGPYFTEHVRRYIDEKYGEDLLYRGGLQVYTTLDVELQKAANDAVSSGLMEHDRRHGYRGPGKRLSDKEEIDDFLNEVDAEILNGKSPETGRVYEVVVTGVNTAERYFMVSIGNHKARLAFEDAAWAKLYNPTDDPDAGKNQELAQTIKKGDVISVSVKAVPENSKTPITVALEQTPLAQASIIAMEPSTGYVRAMTGGADFTKSQFNRAVQAKRQPGSSFKPIIYAAALDKGYTPSSVIVDSPVIFEEAAQEKNKKEDETRVETETEWKPRNYDEKFYGPTTFRQALTHSRNVVTIKILKDIGAGYAIEYARRLGIQSPLNNDLSIALGSSSMSLLELVSAYSPFANAGIKSEPVFITKITDKAGNILESNASVSQQVISPQTAYIMTSLLQGVIQHGTGQRAKALNRPAAGKTGTTNNLNDAWFIGYTSNLLAGSWMGYDDEKPLGHKETGARAALPIWLKFMQKAVQTSPARNFSVPEGVVFTKVDLKTGLPATSATEKTIFEAFKEGTAPTESANTQSGVIPAAEERFFEMDSGIPSGDAKSTEPGEESLHHEDEMD